MKNTLRKFLFVCLIIAAGSQSVLSQKPASANLGPKEFQTQLNKDNGFLMDVRTPEEYMASSIVRSKLCTFNDPSFEAILDMLDKNIPVYVYDTDGINSAMASAMMMRKGFKKVIVLQGGLNAWKKAGLEVVNMKR